jgi:hypothetical protein
MGMGSIATWTASLSPASGRWPVVIATAVTLNRSCLCSDGKVTAELDVTRSLCNAYNTLHGWVALMSAYCIMAVIIVRVPTRGCLSSGASATLVDIIGTAALLSVCSIVHTYQC